MLPNDQALIDEILREKKKNNTLILAHTYQPPEVLAVADLTGDSFAFAKAGESLEAPRALLCGVRFMAETLKILSPEKEVVLSHPDAGCPMAEQINPKEVEAYRKAHPDHGICAYVNTTAELKALADVCVTSSSAVSIVRKLPYQDILFLPDKNLGSFVADAVPEKNIHLMNGYCPVHNEITAQDILSIKAAHPGAKVAIHPECPREAVALADMIGSTKDIISYVNTRDDDIILATERGVYDNLILEFPDRKLYQLCPQKMTCADMKKTNLQQVYDALTGKGGEVITLDESLRLRALGSIASMLRYGN